MRASEGYGDVWSVGSRVAVGADANGLGVRQIGVPAEQGGQFGTGVDIGRDPQTGRRCFA